MKSKLNMLTTASLTGLVGIILGGGVAVYLVTQFQSYATYSRLAADATLQLAALEKIQAGDIQGAKSLLNAALSGNVSALTLTDIQLPASKRDQVAQLLIRADNYRQKEAKSSKQSQ